MLHASRRRKRDNAPACHPSRKLRSVSSAGSNTVQFAFRLWSSPRTHCLPHVRNAAFLRQHCEINPGMSSPLGRQIWNRFKAVASGVDSTHCLSMTDVLVAAARAARACVCVRPPHTPIPREPNSKFELILIEDDGYPIARTGQNSTAVAVLRLVTLPLSVCTHSRTQHSRISEV